MPRRTPLKDFNCSLARTLDSVGDRWTLLIIRDAAMGVDRFGAFQASLGLARNILSDRLTRLCAAGLLDHAPDGAYVLTERGRDLLPALAALTQWGDRWTSDGSPPVLMTDDKGSLIGRMDLRDASGTTVAPAQLRFRAGPGATARTSAQLDRLARWKAPPETSR